jgi:PhnB protein
MPKSKSKKAKAKKTAKKAPIPPGFRTVTPYLTVNGASAAIDWYKKALGAKELRRDAVPGGMIMNAQIRIGDSIVMLSDNFPKPGSPPDVLGTSPVTIHLYSKNVDKLWQQAVDAGAKVTMPIDNMFWGERYGQLTDPFGHKWSMSQQISMSKAEMAEKQKQAMAMFAQGEHPGQAEEQQVAQN